MKVTSKMGTLTILDRLLLSFIFLSQVLTMQSSKYSDNVANRTGTGRPYKNSLIVLKKAELINTHRKSLKYLEKYLLPVKKTIVFPSGISAGCFAGIPPTVILK